MPAMRSAAAAGRASTPPRRPGAGRCQIEGTDVAHNPDVLAAEAQLRAAAITYGHMRLVAPVDGVVAQRTVQVGQQVAAGTPLMAVVPLSECLGRRQFQGSAACTTCASASRSR